MQLVETFYSNANALVLAELQAYFKELMVDYEKSRLCMLNSLILLLELFNIYFYMKIIIFYFTISLAYFLSSIQ